MLLTFLGLMNLRTALSFLVFCVTGGMNNVRIDDSPLAQRQAFVLQMAIDDSEDYRHELIFHQQVSEVHDRGVFRDWRNQSQTRGLAYGRDFIQYLFHHGVAQGIGTY